MNNNTKVYTNDNVKACVVWSSKVARALVKKGYIIIDLKPAKENPDRTIFVFKDENNIRKEIRTLMDKWKSEKTK